MKILPEIRFIIYLFAGVIGLVVMVLSAIAIVLALTYPNLPDLDSLERYRPKLSMRIYTADNILIGEFGSERRETVKISDVPKQLSEAILAAEDAHFFDHGGIDIIGLIRATVINVISNSRRQGASTITQQVARNFFLSPERTFQRKFYEMLLSFKIEKNLSKKQILELYINKIYLGNHSYGFATAARSYFGKTLKDITIAEAALLAGLPKAPSTYNPLVNPNGARNRQLYVLGRMRVLGMISSAQYDIAVNAPIVMLNGNAKVAGHVEYIAEMARQIALEASPNAYTDGYKVYTTVKFSEQEAAYQAMRENLRNFDARHGYRGPESFVNPAEIDYDNYQANNRLFASLPKVDGLIPAVVLEVSSSLIKAYVQNFGIVSLTGEDLKFAARYLAGNKGMKKGSVIRVEKVSSGGWRLTQIPEAESAFVSMDPITGKIRSLVGGFDFGSSQFNHVTLAWRQPGSSFKPFIYSAAIEKGYGPTSIFMDTPYSKFSNGEWWEPKNSDGRYSGPIPMRTALAKSKNMVAIRMLEKIGAKYTQDYVTRFGFDADKHLPYLTMALGAGSTTPWQMIRAYSTFANGGYLVSPYIVDRITDDSGKVIAEFSPLKAAESAPQVITSENAFIINSMLNGVTIKGTAARASVALNRRDLAGKTGTTNDAVDAWFCGYQHTVVACTWLGYDQPKDLGDRETGGTTALPAWIGYMKSALQGVPQHTTAIPPGLVNRGGEYFFLDHAYKSAYIAPKRVEEIPEVGGESPTVNNEHPASDAAAM